ncbi:hypothetical protein K8I61_01840 [bacterium]|nr:hypothetical protein [bacterium]
MKKILVLAAVLVMAMAIASTASAAFCISPDIWCDNFYLQYGWTSPSGVPVFVGYSDGCGGTYPTFPAYFAITGSTSALTYAFYWDFDGGGLPSDDYGVGSGTGAAASVDRYFEGAYYDSWDFNFVACETPTGASELPPAAGF